VLPLLATDAGVRLQVRTGVLDHRERFGAWGGGFWLPECAHDPGLDGRLEEAGVTHTCVELTDLGIDPRRPLRSPDGPLLIGVDRAAIDLVWGAAGYPSRGAYLDTRRYTGRRHLAWSVDGAVYDPAAARARARADAADFVARVEARTAGGGACVVALDTELLGHWWVEGPDWLASVLELSADAAFDVVVASPDTLPEPVDAPPLPVTTWGTPRTLATWSAPSARGLAWRQRAAELRVLAAAPERVSPRVLRELLALQASDWAFLLTRDTAGPYPLERMAGHEAALAEALEGRGGPALRGLAPWLAATALREP
jgi:1,4-alpha-glucan branching enzyme